MARIQELALTRGNRGLLVLAIVAGLAAAVLVFVVLAQNGGDSGGSVAPAAGTTKVVVAAQDIPAGSEVKEGMVKVVEVPQALAVKGAFTEVVPVVGEVTRVAIAQGEQVSPSKVGSLVEGKGLGSVVPMGKRALGIEVKEVTAVGGLLLPGDRVDILAAFEGEGDKPTIVMTVLQNIEVLAVAQEAQKPAPAVDKSAAGGTTQDLATSGQLPDDVETKPNAGTVTVAVDPQQAQILVGVQVKADRVWLALRPFGEETPATLPPTDMASIIGQ